MSTFFLRPPKISVGYLSKSPHSLVSDEQCQVTDTEWQQYSSLVTVEREEQSLNKKSLGEAELPVEDVLDYLQEDALADAIFSKKNDFSQHVDAIFKQQNNNHGSCNAKSDKRVRLKVDGNEEKPRTSTSRLLRMLEKYPRTDYLSGGSPHFKSLFDGNTDPVTFHYHLEQSFSLRSDQALTPLLASLSKPKSVIERVFRGDIIVCIRDEFKPPVENLIRAYAISAELLRSTMDYFRTALQNISPEQEAHGVQISLYVQKDLWEWLLHLAKIQYRQTRDVLPSIQRSLALPLFSTAVLLGIKAGRDICLKYLKEIWSDAVQLRDRSLEHVTENGVEVLAQEVDSDYVELSADHSDWIVEKFYGYWVQDILQKDCFKEQLFPHGTAKDAFFCVYCQKWMNRQLSSVLRCYNKVVIRGKDGRISSVHSRSPDSDIKLKVDELKKNLGTWRAVYWSLYGLLNVIKCADCQEIFQLAEISHCRYHPCDPEPRSDHPNEPMIYPCCERFVSRVDHPKSTGCGFKDHRVDCASLDSADKQRHQRLLTFQRFMWISPRKSAEALSDPDNPVFLAEEIKNAAQDLVAAAWDSAKPLWSNQDCLRQEEKNSLRLLKEYFRTVCKPVPKSTDSQESMPSKESVAVEDTEKAPPPTEPKESLSARTQSSKMAEQTARSIALNKGGPYSGRNRYNPNLVLPPYRGVFSRIHAEWKTKVDALIAAENKAKEERALYDDPAESASKLHDTKSVGAVKKPEVQKIPLRKVVKPLKPMKNRGRNPSKGLFDRETSLLRLANAGRTTLTRRSKLKRVMRPISQRQVKSVKKVARSPKKPFLKKPKAEWDEFRSTSEAHHLVSQTSSTETWASSFAARLASTPSQDELVNAADSLTELARMCFARDSPINTSDLESCLASTFPGDKSASKSIAQDYVFKLVRKLCPTEISSDCGDHQNTGITRDLLVRIHEFLHDSAVLKEDIFSSISRRQQRHFEKKRQHRRNLCQFPTAAETKRFRRRLIRLFRYLETTRIDAFTQPQSLQRQRSRELGDRMSLLNRCLIDAETIWKRKIKANWRKKFADLGLAAYGALSSRHE